MKTNRMHIGPTVTFDIPPLMDVNEAIRQFSGQRFPFSFRGEPDLPKREGRCKVDFKFNFWRIKARQQAYLLAMHIQRGYTGPNVRLGDYYVRELERIGTERRQVVRFEVVGTGRVETIARSRFDKMVRPA